MYKLFVMLIISLTIGCTNTVDTFTNNSTLQDTVISCGKIERVYKVVVAYIDTTYSFGMDSITMAAWGLNNEVFEVNTNECNDKDVQIVHVMQLNYEFDKFDLQKKGLDILDSLGMVNLAKYWADSNSH